MINIYKIWKANKINKVKTSLFCILENILCRVFSLIDQIIPKKPFIIFSCRAAKDYADNSKYLYEYFINSGNNNVYFFTKKKSILKKIPKNAIYAYSFNGIKILLQSKILVFTHGFKDFFPYIKSNPKSKITINLFHAIPVKKVGNEKKREIFANLNHFLVSSEYESKFIRNAYALKDEQILVLGQPRNDLLFSKRNFKNKKQCKIVLYAPTFRDTYSTELFPFQDKNLQELDQRLNFLNVKISIRLHINEDEEVLESQQLRKFKNIEPLTTEECPSINDLLHTFDAVITDYSSIALDFLILDKPIAYIPYDYQQYNNERGFSFPYFENCAGPIIKNQKELIEFLSFQNDHYKLKRKQLLDKFHQFKDAKATKRIHDFIINNYL